MAIDRTQFNLLVDDSGLGTDGSTLDKSKIQTVLLDPIDAMSVVRLIVAPGSNLTLANGRNDNVVVGNTSWVQAINGPTAAFQISGIVPQQAGQVLALFHNLGQVLTLNHNDANSSAANRIYCAGAANKVASSSFGAAFLIYNGVIPGWTLFAIL
jgi:hypothetical protein